MQGPGTEKEAKVSFIIMLLMFLTLILAGLSSCSDQWETENKEYSKKRDAIFKYKEGDVVYLKPDSTIGVITNRILWRTDRLEYEVRYSTKTGKLEYIDTYEINIFGLKY